MLQLRVEQRNFDKSDTGTSSFLRQLIRIRVKVALATNICLSPSDKVIYVSVDERAFSVPVRVGMVVTSIDQCRLFERHVEWASKQW